MNSSACWNQLLPEKQQQSSTASTTNHRVSERRVRQYKKKEGEHQERTESHNNNNNNNKSSNRGENGCAQDSIITLNEWELEAVRRYRAVQSYEGNIPLEYDYLSSNGTYNTLLQLILHSKLIPIKDWHACAHTVAKWFEGPKSAVPLGLLSYTVIQLVTTHQLIPHAAARWILNLCKALLLVRDSNSEVPKILDASDWDIAEELQRSVYLLQEGVSLFQNFSSLVLDTVVSEILLATNGTEMCRLLPFCFLLKRNKAFAVSAWKSNEQQHNTRIQRVCEVGRELSPHLAVVLSVVV
ncbi:hypothetical protein LSM04_001313 [Trypanosoma melophagium]|uniref:uncharacterized protein n=1 Tax=Trypanosoma melophagium TaxID=715481 RepID=UPI003519FFBD|nr:hypothetical protein LSM04_001313 [Trypanosoma melophagium]